MKGVTGKAPITTPVVQQKVAEGPAQTAKTEEAGKTGFTDEQSAALDKAMSMIRARNQTLQGDLAPGAAEQVPQGDLGYGAPASFSDKLLAELPAFGVDPDKVKVAVGTETRSLREAITRGDTITSKMLTAAGLDQWTARNIPAAIEEKSTDPLAWE
jgi:hypothetical protein